MSNCLCILGTTHYCDAIEKLCQRAKEQLNDKLARLITIDLWG